MIQILSCRIEGKGQTCDYTEHLAVNAAGGARLHTLRVRIHTDSYADQAWATIDRYDGTDWRTLARTRGDALGVQLNIGYHRERMPDHEVHAAFQADRERLLALALEVVLDAAIAGAKP